MSSPRETSRIAPLVVVLVVLVASTLVAVPARAGEGAISFADADGQGLVLERLDVRVAAHGPLSLTEMEMVFRNPKDRRIEGKFACELPPGATVSRFAKEVNGRLMEGEVVERLRATRIYTEILHTMADPALLEQDQGNRFKARVYPIEARATVRLLISWSSTHPAGADGMRRIVVPLAGVGPIGRFSMLAVCRPFPGEAVRSSESWFGLKRRVEADRVIFADEATRSDFAPGEDLVLTFAPAEGRKGVVRLRAGDWRMVSLRAPVSRPAGSTAPPRSVHLWVDSSASQARLAAQRLAALQAVVDDLGESLPRSTFALDAFDVKVDRLGVWTGKANGKAMAEFRRRGFLGATDLARVLARMARVARDEPGLHVLVTDAIPSLGVRERAEWIALLKDWPAASRLHVLVVGSAEDGGNCEAIARAGGGRVVRLPLTEAWRDASRAAVADLLRPVGVDVELYDEGALWIEPRVFRDVEPGQELIAFSRVKEGRRFDLGARIGSREIALEGEEIQAPDFAPLLEREAVRAQLAWLEAEEDRTEAPAARAALRAKRLELSVRHRVLCPLTALLVLESEADYQRYGIDRRALADVIVVGKKGIELLRRTSSAVPEREPLRKIEEKAKKKDAEKLSLSSRSEGPRNGGHRDEGGESFGQEAASDESRVDSFTAGSDAPSAAPVDAREISTEQEERIAAEDAADDAEMDRIRARVLSRNPTSMLPGAGEASEEAPAASPTADRTPASPPPPAEAPSVARPRPRPVAPSSGMRRQDLLAAPAGRIAGNVRGGGASAPRHAVEARPAKQAAPAWTSQAFWRPDKALMARLEKLVAASPRDRRARNQLAWALLRARSLEKLRDAALDWQRFDEGNPMVYEYLGEAFRGLDDEDGAIRAFSSIAEVSPGDSGLLNRAAYLALRGGYGDMAVTLFRIAIERRPDHQNNYRGLALALWILGRHEEAAKALETALARTYDSRYGDVKRILREELAMICRSWLEADPSKEQAVAELSRRHGLAGKEPHALRVTLHWETDANDVDLHVVDPAGEECYYSHKRNASGLELYEDLTRGLGPECAVVPAGRLQKGAYHVGVKYFSAGPMGVSRGIVLVQEPDAKGKVQVQIEPFCLLPDLEGQKQDMRHLAVFER